MRQKLKEGWTHIANNSNIYIIMYDGMMGGGEDFSFIILLLLLVM